MDGTKIKKFPLKQRNSLTTATLNRFLDVHITKLNNFTKSESREFSAFPSIT